MDKIGQRKKLDSTTEEEGSERLIEMKQMERKQEKTPAVATEGGGADLDQTEQRRCQSQRAGEENLLPTLEILFERRRGRGEDILTN